MAYSDENDKEWVDIEWPDWLKDILSYEVVCKYIQNRCHPNHQFDLLNIVIERLEKARRTGKCINSGYVFKVLRNCVFDFWRKESRGSRSSEIMDDIDGSKTIISDKPGIYSENHQDLLDEILKQIACLDVRSRVIIKLRLHESYKFTFKDLGNIVGYSESTARQEFNRYITIVREKAKQMGLLESQS